MAKMRNWMKRPDLVRQLLALGVPGDVTPDDLVPDDTSAKLRIDPIGGVVETSAFDLSSGCTGYVLSLSLTVLRTPLAIAAFELSIPWAAEPMIWLSDPAEGNGPLNMYQFPGGNSPEFPRELVINHRVNAQRNLRVGTCIEGLLLGYGLHSLPNCYGHGSDAVGMLAIIDQFGARHSAEITFWVDRSAKRTFKTKKTAPRESLFARPDRRGTPSRPSNMSATRSSESNRELQGTEQMG